MDWCTVTGVTHHVIDGPSIVSLPFIQAPGVSFIHDRNGMESVGKEE